jgi:hypothetical protein
MRFEVFTAMTMKNAVFWDEGPCRCFVNRRFGGTYLLHFQGIKNPRAMNQREQVAVHLISLKLYGIFRKPLINNPYVHSLVPFFKGTASWFKNLRASN